MILHKASIIPYPAFLDKKTLALPRACFPASWPSATACGKGVVYVFSDGSARFLLEYEYEDRMGLADPDSIIPGFFECAKKWPPQPASARVAA